MKNKQNFYRSLWISLLAGLILFSFTTARGYDRDHDDRYDDDDYYEYRDRDHDRYDDDDDRYERRRYRDHDRYDDDDDDRYERRRYRDRDRYDDDRYEDYDDDDRYERRRSRNNRKRGSGAYFMPFSPNSLDSNGDSEITREEAESLGKKIFSDFDSDNSDGVSEEEFLSQSQKMAEKAAELRYGKLSDDRIKRIQSLSQRDFKRLDQNRDSQVDTDEFYMGQIDQMFERMDRNGDGVIQGNEFRRRR